MIDRESGLGQTHGYVRIVPDPRDGRAWLVRLTARGRRLIDTLMSASAGLENEIAQTIGPTELKRLRQQLAALDAALARGSIRLNRDSPRS